MITDQDRLYLFMGCCVPLRAGLAYAAYKASPKSLSIMGIVALIASISFLIVWITGSRQDKGAFEGKVWWNYTRPIHALILFTFAINALQQNTNSWMYLASDVIAGSAFFTYNRLTSY